MSAMNVLIYSGPESLQRSVDDAVTTLRSILLPHYSVQTISLQAITTQPWTASCAVFVLPCCNIRLNQKASTLIKEYVETGGSFLGLGAGVITSLHGHSDTTRISKGLLIEFFDKTTQVFTYLTFPSGDNQLAPRSVGLKTPEGQSIEVVRDNLLRFDVLEGSKNVHILANYVSDSVAPGLIAGIQHNVGNGKIAIWAPRLEVSLTTEPASPLSSASTLQSISPKEQHRLDLLRNTLISLSLPLSSPQEKPVPHPLPQFLTSTPSNPTIVTRIADCIVAPSESSDSPASLFVDENDTFQVYRSAEGAHDLLKIRRESTASDPEKWQPKHLICSLDTIPDQSLTPLFNLGLYYESLSKARKEQQCRDVVGDTWGIGEALLYGEVVTSTQTMLDKNPHLLTRLPSPIVSLASYQLTGRGRGSNIWVSPPGCLTFSILLRASLASFPASKLVFVQYLFSLAVVEACRDEEVLGKRGEYVRVKWPNDIYAISNGEQRKIGGILVNASFSSTGKVDIVIGCGLNVLNTEPIFSLGQLIPEDQRPKLLMERTLAVILARFENMWDTLVKEHGSFDSFMDLYLERWLHSDQLVTLTTVSPPKRVRIVGITPDHGLLRTSPENWMFGQERYVDLQPDGNSFDMMAGLIKSKT